VPLKTDEKRRTAMVIVIAEEQARGWNALPAGSWSKEKELGCDLLSTPPDGSSPDPVEVKAWGESFLDGKGRWRYSGQDIRVSQLSAVFLNSRYRLEIVANVDAYLAGEGKYERLTLSAGQIIDRVIPLLYDVPLAGLEQQVRVGNGESRMSEGPQFFDWPIPEPGPGMQPSDSENAFVWPGEPSSLPSLELALDQIPSDEASWTELCWFAATLDGYALVGDDLLREVANTSGDYFARLGFLPSALGLDLLRACLFFEYRRHHHFGHAPDASSTRYIRALVRQIRREVEMRLSTR
jgi:hypothetical protein